ncbi:MAG: hypothetical protein F6K54_12365 [Okeania sp. SIO3B5]|uniref:hypothetical protein n=1 Tax=Okeania sp. SIO3B5 TaxID=2607811 RepID=UPI0013FEF3D7|nr:hypothetical protein [Okeania sp. SIO3B5]NEO53802.1 hypothetical protein [Okeania sp. SIO3B5]
MSYISVDILHIIRKGSLKGGRRQKEKVKRNVGWVERSETQQSFIPNSKEVVTALIPNFPPADKTAVVIFYEICICIIGVGFILTDKLALTSLNPTYF